LVWRDAVLYAHERARVAVPVANAIRGFGLVGAGLEAGVAQQVLLPQCAAGD